MRCQFHGRITTFPFLKHSRTISIAAVLSASSFIPSVIASQPRATLELSAISQVNQQTKSNRPTQRAGFAGDSDGDGVPDIIDVDDDNDTIPDDIEGTADADGDSVPDCLDLDSDNDGISDLLEAVSGSGLMLLIDSNRDGKLDANVAVGENGLADVVELSRESGTSSTGTNDLDGDGVRDHQDLDVDNDGIPDVVEAGSSDNNFDGRYDFFLDLDADGMADRLSASPILARDSDQDGVEDFRDIDSDQDGLTDLLETTGIDADGDGRVDNFIDLNIDGLNDAYNTEARSLPDTDQDGFPDYRDIDSDGDGVSDAEEGFGNVVPSAPIVPSTPFNPRPTTQNDEITLQTGESGSVFGCTLSYGKKTRQSRDPVLILMLVAAVTALLRRRAVLVPFIASSSRRRWSLLFLMASVFLSACASAPGGNSVSSASPIQAYAGLGVGASFLNANTTGLELEQEDSISAAGQLTLGVSMGPRFAVEARAADLGEATFTNGDAVGYQVADVSALYKSAFSKLTGFGRLGVGSLFNDGDIPTTQKNKTHVLVGLGADYALTPAVSLRAEWQGHDVDVMHSQLSFVYRFGAPPQSRNAVIANAPATTSPQTIADSSFQAVPKKADKPKPIAKPNPPRASVPTTKPVTPEPVSPPAPKPIFSTPITPRPVPVPVPVPAPSPAPVPVPPTESAQVSESAAESPLVADVATDSTVEQTATPAQSTSDEQLALAETQAELPDKTEPARLKPLVTVPIERNKVQSPADNDQDGIVDASDKCLGTSAGVPVFADGCSMFSESVPGLTFEPDTDQLTASAKAVLDTVADALTDESDIRVTVAAHTKASTDPNAAMFLTRRRTIAIIRYLSEKGIAATRLRPEAYGDTQPLANAVEPSDNDRVVLSPR